MRLSPAATVGVLLGLALVLAACGGEHTTTTETTRAARSEAKANSPAAPSDCRSQLGGLLGSMDTLRGKLAVGLSYTDYLHEVRETKTVYSHIPTRRLAIDCLASVGTPAERALNWYLNAANTWGDCLADASCSTESVEPKLQHKWALASALLSSAQKELRRSSRS